MMSAESNPIAHVPRQAGAGQLAFVVLAGLGILFALLASNPFGLPEHSAWFWFSQLALAPFLEEWVFRVGIQSRLAERLPSGHLANLVTGVLFGLAHLAVRGGGTLALLVVLPSGLIGEVYRRRGTFLTCALLHSMLNACWLAGLSSTLPRFLSLAASTNPWGNGWS